MSSRSAALAAALALMAGSVMAQSGGSSPNQYGDRQTGHFGDPSQGHFGNPASGDFDKSQIKVPPNGVRPMGRLVGRAVEPSPYVNLPTPKDAAAVPAEQVKPAATKKKSKRAKK